MQGHASDWDDVILYMNAELCGPRLRASARGMFAFRALASEGGCHVVSDVTSS